VDAEADLSNRPRELEDSTRTIEMPGGAVGESIGPYRLIRPLGEGGMGVVYHAQQMQPIRRDVALKIIKPGMDSRQVILRFESERQALAVMDHPNIARVFDAGTTASGLPYFAMELVNGVPITRYCDEKRLTIRERLALFVPVCQAIQHAHQKGIIHRDIKPSNILVADQEDKPAPKVIDFGLAKALGPHLNDTTVMTNLGTVVGTLDYMSPEQAELTHTDIDTRSDVYSLGAVLYELLAGTTPLEREMVAKEGYVRALQRIREEETPPPSLRLKRSTTFEHIAAARRSDAARLPKLLGGELDWMVMKALEKDRRRRYETANAMARDIERYLEGEPIEAAPPSAAYRVGKFVRRHRTWLSVAAAFGILLIASVVVASWLAVRATRAEQEARAVDDFLQKDLLAQADAAMQSSAAPRDADIKVRTLLDRAAAGLSGKFAAQPLVEASIRNTIADAYLGLGLGAEALRQAERAVEIRRRVLGPENPATLASLAKLGRAQYSVGQFQQAETLYRTLLEVQKRKLGAEHPDTLETMSALAQDYWGQSKTKEAEELDRKVLAIRKRVLGSENPATLDSQAELVVDLTRESRYAEAEELERTTLASISRRLGADHPATVSAMNNLAVILFYEGKYDGAASLLAQVRDVQQRVHGAEHPLTVTAISNLARVLASNGEFERSRELDVEVADIYRRTQGPEHRLTGVAVSNLGGILINLGRFAEAEPVVAEAIRIRTHNFGADNPETLLTRDFEGQIRRGQKRYAEAAAIHREVLTLEQRALGPKHASTLTTMYRLAAVLADDRHYAEAETLDREASQMLQQTLGAKHPTTLATTVHLAYVLENEGRPADAEPLLRAALKELPADSWQRFNCESLLGASLGGQRKFEEAEPLLLSGYSGMAERQTRIPALDRVYLVRSGDSVVGLYREWAKPAKVEEWRRKLAAQLAPGQ
jgi:serine/threonine protein kinase